jgi:glycosyltransferase involved in cell wall biosynthesis
MAPLAAIAGCLAAWKVARRENATIVHGHWVVPGGVIAAAAVRDRPLVVSLHGSDVYVAEKNRVAGRAARYAFGCARWVTACSDDLARRAIALGADERRMQVVPYGVDAERFRPDAISRTARRTELGLAADTPLVLAAGRLVRKKGFEHLLDACAQLAGRWPTLALVIAGGGDLADELRARVEGLGIRGSVRFLGDISQSQVAAWLAAADLVVVPSVRDDAGNVDGLPNVVMEALASGTPLVATPAGGIGAVVQDGRTAVIVPERNAAALAEAIDRLLSSPELRAAIGAAARRSAIEQHGWARVAEQFEAIYDRVATPREHSNRGG